MTSIQYDDALLKLSDKLYYYALSLTADSERANELLQETMLKVLTSRDKFRQPHNFKAWVFTIMKNTFINEYRMLARKRNNVEFPDPDLYAMYSMEKLYPDPDTINNVKEIKKKIDALEDHYRIPFTMFFEGFKYKEIADKLDLPIGTVKSRIYCTRMKLKKSLQAFAIN